MFSRNAEDVRGEGEGENRNNEVCLVAAGIRWILLGVRILMNAIVVMGMAFVGSHHFQVQSAWTLDCSDFILAHER